MLGDGERLEDRELVPESLAGRLCVAVRLSDGVDDALGVLVADALDVSVPDSLADPSWLDDGVAFELCVPVVEKLAVAGEADDDAVREFDALMLGELL